MIVPVVSSETQPMFQGPSREETGPAPSFATIVTIVPAWRSAGRSAAFSNLDSMIRGNSLKDHSGYTSDEGVGQPPKEQNSVTRVEEICEHQSSVNRNYHGNAVRQSLTAWD